MLVKLKPAVKLPIAVLTGLLIMLSISSCSKKNDITTNNNTKDSTNNNNNNNNNNNTPPVYGQTSTFAGSGVLGAVDGVATAARFNRPASLAIDASGNIYVADSGDNLIRKISPAGFVTTIAGSGGTGADNGQGTSASFNYPYGIAVDVNGNVYVADSGNNLIRKITPAGMVSTLAGSGMTGSADGVGTSASFGFPMALTVDLAGNVYVADNYYNIIRKITPAGKVTTLAGTGTYGFVNGKGTAASFDHPQGIVVDAAGNLYVDDTDNYAIRKITPDGTVTTIAGNGVSGYAGGIGTAATFGDPMQIAIDSNGNLFVADAILYLIRKVSPSGEVTVLAGNGLPGSTNGIGTGATFGLPEGIAVDNADNVYVADYNNNNIRKIDAKQ